MKISLVINSKNPNPGWLAQCLLSAQGFDEKIVYFDGEEKHSDDDKTFSIGDGRSRSIPEGFNFAVGKSTGDWICAFCDDDYFISENLQELIQQIKGGTFKYADVVHFPVNAEGGSWGSGVVNDDILIANQIPFGSFYRREVFEKIRGYHTSLKVYHDWNFWLRAYKAGFKFMFFPSPVYYFRTGHHSAACRQLEEVGGQQNAAEMVRAHV